MSLRDLCADSGFSIGGLYAYIRSKEDLLGLIQGHGFLLTRRTMLAYTQDVAAPRDKLLAAVKAHVYLCELMQPWFYFSFMDTTSLPAKKKKRIQHHRSGIATHYFRLYQGRNGYRICKP